MLDGGRRSPRPGRAGDVFTDQLYTHQLLVCVRGCVTVSDTAPRGASPVF